MNFDGDIIFAISDSDCINIDLGLGFLPTRTIKKGDIIALGRKAPKNRWLYVSKFKGEKEYLEKIDKLTEQMINKIEDISKVIAKYEFVSIDIIFVQILHK